MGAAADTWSPANPMGTARIWHTATLLSDGRVLVSGGSSGTALISATIYDPASGTWSPSASMAGARLEHSSTRLLDGRVLVIGGHTGNQNNALATAEIYSPAAPGSLGTWSPAASMGTGRVGHTATLLADGRVLVSGGLGGGAYLASAQIYTPGAPGAPGAWSPIANMGITRFFHIATLLSDNRVLVSGGHNGVFLGSAEIYDPAVPGLGWVPTTNSMSTPRYIHTATLLTNGWVMINGGTKGGNVASGSAELYKPELNSWSPTGSMGTARSSQTATLLPDGRVLVSGGYEPATGFGYVASAEIYDPAFGAWTPTASMSTARAFHKATLLLDGGVLVSGGHNGTAIIPSAEIFDLPLVGAQGPAGPAGPQGPQGATGATGPAGPTGPAGATGETGATGPAGPQGAPGTNGTNGIDGTNGLDGEAGPIGPAGATGQTGLTGAMGATGAQGPQGVAGDAGQTGAAGADGAVGPQGPIGATGADGAAGPQGLQGEQGATGNQGPQGLAGATGAVGPAGPTGATGAAGPQGVAGLSGLQYIAGTPATLLKLTTGTAIAMCPSGRSVIGGGSTTGVPAGSNANPAYMQVFNSVNSGSTSWSVSGTNAESGGGNRSLTLTAYAICAIVQ